MKYFLTISFLIYFSLLVKADCANSGIWASSISKTVTSNSLFLIEGYAQSMDVIKDLNKKYPVYIESNSHKVKLEVIKFIKGKFRLNQAIVRPSEKLKAGSKYYIKIEDLGDKHPKSYWGGDENHFISEGFLIIEENKSSSDEKWHKQPVFISSEVKHFGCGPSIYAYFNVSLVDTNYTHIETELVNKKTGISQTYLIDYNKKEKQVAVGHGMCSGAFDYSKNGKYKVRFRVPKCTIDSPDNEWSDWIIFDSPYKSIDVRD